MAIRNHIPNSITSMNLLCGVMGVIFTIEGRPDVAFPLMILGALFDFCDGLAARMLKAYSDIGKELDSLADMVTFGVLPSVLLFKTMEMSQGHMIWCYIPLALAAFSALRLAKFNIDERQHSSFIGMPTPACAMICGSLAYFIFMKQDSAIASIAASVWVIPVVSVILGLLLVCEVPMFGMKFATGEKTAKAVNTIRIIFFASAIVYAALVAAFKTNWSMIILATFTTYIVLNVVLYLINHGKEN